MLSEVVAPLLPYGGAGMAVAVVLWVIKLFIDKGYRIKVDVGPK